MQAFQDKFEAAAKLIQQLQLQNDLMWTKVQEYIRSLPEDTPINFKDLPQLPSDAKLYVSQKLYTQLSSDLSLIHNIYMHYYCEDDRIIITRDSTCHNLMSANKLVI